MVAIIGGGGLGLNLSSLASLRDSSGGSSHAGQSGQSAYLNISNGNLVVQNVDCELRGLSQTLTDLRTYNSQGRFENASNNPWIIAGFKAVTAAVGSDSATLQRIDSDGTLEYFQWDSSRNVFLQTQSTGGALNTIELNGGSYIYTDSSSGASESYRASGSGLIQSTSDVYGNTTTFHYDDQDRLVGLSDANGETIAYSYDAVGNLTSESASSGDGQCQSRVTYGYDGLKRLMTVSVALNPGGDATIAAQETSTAFTTTYGYLDDTNLVNIITQGDGTQVRLAYTQVGAKPCVSAITDGAGNITRIGYDTANNATTVTDPLGNASIYHYDDYGRLHRIDAGVVAANDAGLSHIQYEYNALGELVQSTDGQGRTVSRSYDSNGNGNLISYAYDNANRLLRSSTGGVQTVYYDYDKDGNLTRTYDPSGSGTSYSYFPDNMGIASVNDALGNGSNYSRYSDGLLASYLDPNFNADRLARWSSGDYSGQLYQTTNYYYDAAQRLWMTTDPMGAATRYNYDANGNQISMVDPNGNSIYYAYDAAKRRITSSRVPLFNRATFSTMHVRGFGGFGSSTTYDARGNIVAYSDANGNVVARTDENGNFTYYSFDGNNRLTSTTDATGAVTRYTYDAKGNRTSVTDANGNITRNVYDAANQLIWTVPNLIGPETLLCRVLVLHVLRNHITHRITQRTTPVHMVVGVA